MELIDDRGRLFGVVNVIDALVALLAVAVLVAGVAFVTAPDGERRAVRYVTVEVGPENPETLRAFGGAGTTIDGAGADHLGTFVAPADGGNQTALVTLRVRGEMHDGEFVADGGRFRAGQPVALEGARAELKGEVLGVAADRPDPGESRVTVVAEVPTRVAAGIEAGDSLTSGNRSAVRIESVSLGPAANGTTRATVTATVTTLRTDAGVRFGGTLLRPGADVTLATDGYEFGGVVVGLER